MPESEPQHISDAMLEQMIRAGLPESEVATLQDHLQACLRCRARLREMQQRDEGEPVES